jgi:Zn-dependent protease
MFGRPVRIGRLFGIQITVSLTTLLVVGLIAHGFVSESRGWVEGLSMGVAYAVLLFASILAHELGHSLVAQRLGVQIAEIELHFFGGAAKMLSMPKRPRDEILISAAGPLVSFILAGLVGAALYTVYSTGFGGHVAFDILARLTGANAILGVFNLLPALPMDGGRIFRAALTGRLGALLATRVSVNLSKVIAAGLGLWGLWPPMNLFLTGIAVFIWWLASRELRIAEMMHGQRQGVEVFDQAGRPLTGMTSADGFPAPQSMGQDIWGEAPNGARPEMYPERVMMVRGADGRVWVITRRS